MVIARQAPQICPPMIPFCSRFDSVLFTPKMPSIAGCFNFSRSPQPCLLRLVQLITTLRNEVSRPPIAARKTAFDIGRHAQDS
jgi:hypothetical protein